MKLKGFINTELGGISGLCDVYLNGITKNKFIENMQSNKDLIIFSLKKLNISSDIISKIDKSEEYEDIKNILIYLKGGNKTWN